MATVIDSSTVLKFLPYLNAASPHFLKLVSCSQWNQAVQFSLSGVFLSYELNILNNYWTILVISYGTLHISKSWSISSKSLNLWTWTCFYFILLISVGSLVMSSLSLWKNNNLWNICASFECINIILPTAHQT